MQFRRIFGPVHRLALALALVFAGCSAPERLSHHRSTLVQPPVGPYTPEGRPAEIPAGEAGSRVPADTALGEKTSGATPEGNAGATSRAPPPASTIPEKEPVRTTPSGEALARTAAGLIGRRTLIIDGKRYPNDCTGLARAVYAAHGVDLMTGAGKPGDNGVTAIYRYALKHGSVHRDSPLPGDLVFFRETYDRNRDGRDNDGLTHVGIVEAVEPNGTVLVVHRVARGVVRYRMNTDHPREQRDKATGLVLNDMLRHGKRSRTAGELFAGYGTLDR